MSNSILAVGTITRNVEVKDFTKKTGESGYLVKLSMDIGEGNRKHFKTVIFWNSMRELEELQVGDAIAIQGRLENSKGADGKYYEQVVGSDCMLHKRGVLEQPADEPEPVSNPDEEIPF